MAHIKSLTDIGPRVSGTEGDVEARNLIASHLQGLGYEVEMMEFTRVNGAATANVVARPPGADFSGGGVVVAAHFDTEPGTPGANDNASGTGVLMALAASFSELAIPVQFVAFGAEEWDYDNQLGLEGSAHFVENLEDPSTIEAMVSIDMIGNGNSVRVVTFEGSPIPLRDDLLDLAMQLAIPAEAGPANVLSDHISFTDADLPAVHLWSGPHETLHKPTDTFDVVQPQAVERTGDLVHAWLLLHFGISP